MIKKVDHIGIVVEDLEKALKVYSQYLGLECVEVKRILPIPRKKESKFWRSSEK